MPYVYDPNLENQQQQQQQLASGASQVKLSEGSSTGEAQPSAPTGGTKELNTGSQFQNLDKYLQANNGQQFANDVVGKVQSGIDQAKQNQSQVADQFQNVVHSANSLPDQTQIQGALNNPSTTDSKTFQNWMNQSYQGPKSLGENQGLWNQYWSGTNQAEANSKALGSEGGRFALLDQYYGRPQYNQGEKSLDNLLIQNKLGDQPQNLANQSAQLRAQGNQQATQLQNEASQQSAAVDQSRNSVNQAYQTAQQQAQQQVTDTLAQQQAQRVAQQQTIQKDVASGKLSQDELAQLGLKSGQNIYDLDLNQYLNLNSNPLTQEQVATPEERARLDALSQLAGVDQTFLGAQSTASNPYQFDSGGFNTAVASRQSQYNQALSAIDAQNTSVDQQIADAQALYNATKQLFDQSSGNVLGASNPFSEGSTVYSIGGPPALNQPGGTKVTQAQLDQIQAQINALNAQKNPLAQQRQQLGQTYQVGRTL